MSRTWTRREKITGVIAVLVHVIIVWHVWVISLKTPRNVQFINCEGEITEEKEMYIDKPPEKPQPITV